MINAEVLNYAIIKKKAKDNKYEYKPVEEKTP